MKLKHRLTTYVARTLPVPEAPVGASRNRVCDLLAPRYARVWRTRNESRGTSMDL